MVFILVFTPQPQQRLVATRISRICTTEQRRDIRQGSSDRRVFRLKLTPSSTLIDAMRRVRSAPAVWICSYCDSVDCLLERTFLIKTNKCTNKRLDKCAGNLKSWSTLLMSAARFVTDIIIIILRTTLFC